MSEFSGDGKKEDMAIMHDHDDEAVLKSLKKHPLKSDEVEEQRYSSRVVNTETVFVEGEDVSNGQYHGKEKYQGTGADIDDPSSGMS